MVTALKWCYCALPQQRLFYISQTSSRPGRASKLKPRRENNVFSRRCTEQTEQAEQNTTPVSSSQQSAAAQPEASTSKAPWAAGAVGLGVAVFLATRLAGGGVSILSLERASVPLDVALANHRPSVLEFYADWCEVCRELVPDVYKVQLFTCCFVSIESSGKRVPCRWSRSMGTESTLCC